MKLQVFNGGLNIRQAAELIQPNEAVICNNVDLSSGQIVSANSLGVTPITNIVDPYYFKAEQTWQPNATSRDYLEYRGKLYWTNGALAQKHFNGNTYNLGIEQPSNITVSKGGVGNVTGTVQYLYTYYNDLDATESQPSPISLETVVTAQQVGVTVTASPDPQATHIFIYRIGGGLLSFTKVAEYPNTSSVRWDNTTNAAATTTLSSDLNGVPPLGLQFLSEAYGVFFGAVGERLYYTREGGNPNNWPETNYIDFQDTITGIGIVPAGVVVFTYVKATLIVGTTPATFQARPISGSQGCILHKTIQLFNNTIMFASTDGICTLIGTRIDIISKFKLGKQTYGTIGAIVHDEIYYLQLTDQSIVAMDLRYEPAIKTLNFNTTWLVNVNDVLYGQTSSGLLELFQGTPSEYHYRTGNLSEGSTATLKNYNDIWVSLEGDHTVDVLIDDVVVSTKTVTGVRMPTQFTVPQENQRGSTISFDMRGVGKVREISYVATGRS